MQNINDKIQPVNQPVIDIANGNPNIPAPILLFDMLIAVDNTVALASGS